MATDSDFNDIKLEKRSRGTQVELGSQLKNGRYFVRYQVLNDEGLVSDTSPTYKIRLN